MEKFIEALAQILKPPWNYVVGIVAALLIVLPRLEELRRSWLDLRLGQGQLEREKLRLEVLKLRIELRQLAKEQPPEVAREVERVAVPTPSIVPPAPPSPPPLPPLEHRGPIRRFLAQHPRPGWIVMLIVQILVGYLMVTFAIGAVASPFIFWKDPNFGTVGLIVLVISYAVFGWLSYKGFEAAGSFRRELARRQQATTAEGPKSPAAEQHIKSGQPQS